MSEARPRPKRFNGKKAVSIFLQAVILGLLIWYFLQNRDVFAALKNVTWQAVLFIILLEFASFVVNSYLNYSMIRRFDRRVSFLDCFLLQYVNNLLNKILPTVGGGAAFRAVYLKQKYQFPYTRFTSTVAGLYTISFFSTALIAITCLLIIYARYQVFNWVIFLAFSGILLVTVAVILFSPEVPPSERRMLKALRSVIEGWKILKKDLGAVLLYTLLTITLLTLAALHNLVVYQALGENPNPVAVIYLSTLGILMAFLNFTPDGIGVKEGILIFSKDLVQIPDSVLVLGSIILRAISIFTTFSMGGISYWVLMKRMKSLQLDPGEVNHKIAGDPDSDPVRQK